MENWLEHIFGWHRKHEDRVEHIERILSEIMSNIKDLNDAIAALPQRIADEVIPLIPAPSTGGGGVDNPMDTTVQVEALAKVPGQVASLVAAAIAAGSGTVTPPPVIPAPLVVTNEDGSVTTTTYNADGTVATIETRDSEGNSIPNPGAKARK